MKTNKSIIYHISLKAPFLLLILFFVFSCGGGSSDDSDPVQYTNCLAILNALPESVTGLYTIDPDSEGGSESFVTWCDMDTDGGGWTLVGIVSPSDSGESWTDFDVWTDSTTFGDINDANDYKNVGWSAVQGYQLLMKANSYTGIKTSTYGQFGQLSLANLFNTSNLVSLSGVESNWQYNNGDSDTSSDSEFFAEIQNPPATAYVNFGARNRCILTTAFDAYFGEDQVEGFGCIAGSGVGGTQCDTDGGVSCGDTSREDETWFYVR